MKAWFKRTKDRITAWSARHPAVVSFLATFGGMIGFVIALLTERATDD
jgi:hypothetical protein